MVVALVLVLMLVLVLLLACSGSGGGRRMACCVPLSVWNPRVPMSHADGLSCWDYHTAMEPADIAQAAKRKKRMYGFRVALGQLAAPGVDGE